MTIRVTRKKGYFGSARALKVRLDGQDVGQVKAGGSLDVRGSGEDQALRFHMDWMASRPFPLRDPEPGIVEIEVRMPPPFVGLFRTFIAPRTAIPVERVGG